ncbi:MAG: circadian clock KaiB family protein [Bacteroidales bacterium]
MVSEEPKKWHLCLYVAGDKQTADNSVGLLKQICEENIAGKYEIEVFDIMANPQIALEENIIATPYLIKKRPPPKRKLIGELTDKARLLRGIGIENNPDL